MANKKSRFMVYTDGGADPNPGPGGWAAILIDDQSGAVRELSGSEANTTNNRMELTAAIRALESLIPDCEVQLFTDSEYLRRGVTEWLPGWIAAGWSRKRGAVLNLDLWRRLSELAAHHEVRWEWVRGHTGDRYNERADQLATKAIRGASQISAALNPVDAEIFLRVSCVGANGGWAALIRRGTDERVVSGPLKQATANQCDLVAAAEALRAAPDAQMVRIWTASDYLRNGATQWLAGWQRQGWKVNSGGTVKNLREWQALALLLEGRAVDWPASKTSAPAEFARLDPVARTESARAAHR